jgi:hypothetical protein
MNARRLLIMYPHDGWYHNQRPDRHVFNLHNSKCAKHSRAEQSRASRGGGREGTKTCVADVHLLVVR